jgi:hypothetical protein
MNLIRRIRRIAGVLAGLACAWLGLAVAAPAAFAARSVPGAKLAGVILPAEPGQAAVAAAEHHESPTGGLPAPLPAHIHPPMRQAPSPVPVHTVVAGGMPGWQIALIAAAAALIAAMVAVLVRRAQTARRKSAAAAA